jgi:hypothetical protein
VTSGQETGLGDQFFDRSGSADSARDSGRAERALPIAPVLDLHPPPAAATVGPEEDATDRLLVLGRESRFRGYLQGHRHRVLPLDHGVDFRHGGVLVGFEGGRAPGHHDAQIGMAATEFPNQAACGEVRLVGDRARIEHGRRRRLRHFTGRGAPALELLAHSFSVVLVGFATEGVIPDRNRHSHSPRE